MDGSWGIVGGAEGLVVGESESSFGTPRHSHELGIEGDLEGLEVGFCVGGGEVRPADGDAVGPDEGDEVGLGVTGPVGEGVVAA